MYHFAVYLKPTQSCKSTILWFRKGLQGLIFMRHFKCFTCRMTLRPMAHGALPNLTQTSHVSCPCCSEFLPIFWFLALAYAVPSALPYFSTCKLLHILKSSPNATCPTKASPSCPHSLWHPLLLTLLLLLLSLEDRNYSAYDSASPFWPRTPQAWGHAVLYFVSQSVYY